MKKIAVLISDKGKGTNLGAIIDAIRDKKIDARIVVVISDTENALGLTRAKKNQIETAISPTKENLLPILLKFKPDYIALAGWKQIITDDVIDVYSKKILNVHPGLVPDSKDGLVKNPDGSDALWNKGKLADRAVQNFLEQKATYAGSSVHFLTHEFDFGPVVVRGFVKVESDDSVDSLYGRLKEKEHVIYIKSLQKLCNEDER